MSCHRYGLIGQFATSASYAQGHQHGAATQTAQTETPATPPTPTDSPAAPAAPAAAAASNYHNPTTFTLRTGIAQGRMVYIGVGGDIDGQVNPTLTIYEGELIQINLINGVAPSTTSSSTTTMPGRSMWSEGTHPRRSHSPQTTRESSPISAPLPDIDKRAWKD